jgi:hypothetical protein
MRRKRDPRLGQLKGDLDGLAEKPRLLELFCQGHNAKEACAVLGVAAEDYRRWIDTDASFRQRILREVIRKKGVVKLDLKTKQGKQIFFGILVEILL